MSEGPTTVGSIKGKVEIDIAEALAQLEAVKAAARNIGGRDAKINVDTREAVRQTENLDRSTRKMGDGFKQAAEQQADLRATGVNALVAISAALPPVAAGATAALGALGLMGVGGGLAIAGIARGMKDGTGAGVQYAGMIKTLQGNVHALQDSAAIGLLPGFEKTVDRLQQRMPMLNSVVQEFSGRLGDIAPTGLDAVFNLMERGLPAFRSGADLIEHLVNGLNDFSMSPEYGKFIDYTVKNMPQVARFLDEVIGLAGDFLGAWGQLGEAALPVLTDLVSGLGDIIRATGPLVPAVIAFAGAWKALSGVSGMLSGIITGLKGVAAAAVAADVAGGFGSVGGKGKGGKMPTKGGKLGGIAGGALNGIGGGPLGLLGAATVGSVIANAGTQAPKAAQASGATYGASWNGYAGAETGNAAAATKAAAAADRAAAARRAEAAAAAAATAKILDQIKAENDSATLFQGVEDATNGAKDSIAGLTDQVKQNGTSLDQNTAKGRSNREYLSSFAAQAIATGTAITKQTGSLAAGREATDKLGISMVNAATKMGIPRKQAETLIKQLLGIPSNVSIEADMKIAKAQHAAEQAKKFGEDYAKGKYQAILDGDFTPAQKAAAEAGKRAKDFSASKYEAKLRADGVPAKIAAQLAHDRAASFARAAYEAKLRADGSQAYRTISDVQRRINGIYGKSVTVTVNYATGSGKNIFTGTGGLARGGTTGIRGAADGITAGFSGSVMGPGTASSDTAGLYRLANGEEVISNMFGQADRWRPLLKAINSNKLDGDFIKRLSGAARSQVVIRTVQPVIHINNPVSVDPVRQVTEAAQQTLAAAGIG